MNALINDLPDEFSSQEPWQVQNSSAELDCRRQAAPEVGAKFEIAGKRQVIVSVTAYSSPIWRPNGWATHRIEFRPLR